MYDCPGIRNAPWHLAAGRRAPAHGLRLDLGPVAGRGPSHFIQLFCNIDQNIGRHKVLPEIGHGHEINLTDPAEGGVPAIELGLVDPTQCFEHAQPEVRMVQLALMEMEAYQNAGTHAP